jgi:Trypsin-like peptidase domain
MRNSIVEYAWLVAAFIGVTAVPANAQNVFQAILNRSMSGVAQLETFYGHKSGGPGYGTAFTCSNNRVLITNYHCIQGAKQVFASFPDAAGPIECHLIDKQPGKDLAALWLLKAPAGNPHVFPILNNVNNGPQPLDPILVIGHPHGTKHSPLLGHFSKSVQVQQDRDLRQRALENITVFQIQVPGGPGISGAPVLNKNGEAIGAFFAGRGQGEFQLNFAIPLLFVANLDLKKQPQKFSNELGLPVLQTAFGGTGTRYLSDRAALTVRGPGNTSLSVASRHWENVPRDPDLIFARYIDDPVRFAALTPREHLRALVNRKRITLVTNASFRYRVLVAEGYDIQESIQPDGVFESRITMQGQNGGVRITGMQVQPPRNQLEFDQLFDAHVGGFVQNVLRKRLVPQFIFPPGPDQVIKGPLTDLQPRVGLQSGAVRLWEHYVTAPQFDVSHLVLYRLDGDLFTTLDIAFPTSEPFQPVLRERFVEDLFTALSFHDLVSSTQPPPAPN